MKKIYFLSLIFTLLLTVLAFSPVRAQEDDPAGDENQIPRRAARPFKIMQELELTREQIQQIRQINQTRRPIMQDAAHRWQTARRNLDAAIYSDDSTEERVKELTKEAAFAQSELLKERTLTEYLIRKVLTPEQLVKFRQLRQQLMRRVIERKNLNNQVNPNDEPQPQRPLNRFQQRRKQNRGQ
jgi:Spy/CpxP family protein refolding chaperone